MTLATNLGFPRIGARRELKDAVEAYWSGGLDAEELETRAAEIRKGNWLLQRDEGLDQVPCGDFSLYDHVLDTAVMLGAVPFRYGWEAETVDLDTYFAMARGRAGDGNGNGAVPAMEMTKWFDTNYHFIVPELEPGQRFRLASTKVVDEFTEARSLGIDARPVLLGPVSFLLLGKSVEDGPHPLSLLDEVLPVYEDVLERLRVAGARRIQMDEPCLGSDLPDEAAGAYRRAYRRLTEAAPELELLVASYFGELRENLDTALALPVAGLHLDVTRGGEDLHRIRGRVPDHLTLSVGVVDGRNVWRTDLAAALDVLEPVVDELGADRVEVAPSCSLLHTPVDLDLEEDLDPELRSWMAFARQKVGEVATLARALDGGREVVEDVLTENARAMEARVASERIHDPRVKERAGSVDEGLLRRNRPYRDRAPLQHAALGLPPLPTTTVGSFPQTAEIRRTRAAHRRGELGDGPYEAFLRRQIEEVVGFQEEAGLDVLVHGEPERSDMVEYFAERLQGFTATTNGWVQSYGSRCVKPPVILGDVRRPEPMSVDLTAYAQSLTDRPVKGMLTGPVTMVQWSFVRDDQPRSETARQVALAIRDEVRDLEAAGLRVIQIDEPAFREGMPLRSADRDAYLRWAVDAFRIASSGVRDDTQIHTHMCYSEFNEILDAIAELDADVISLEASRSRMELLGAFVRFEYPSEVGPGVFDIHSPRIPPVDEMEELILRAASTLPPERLWVNPDCGLKTRTWEEVRPALRNLVEAAERVRRRLG